MAPGAAPWALRGFGDQAGTEEADEDEGWPRAEAEGGAHKEILKVLVISSGIPRELQGRAEPLPGTEVELLCWEEIQGVCGERGWKLAAGREVAFPRGLKLQGSGAEEPTEP